jgi:hypothetical protein
MNHQIGSEFLLQGGEDVPNTKLKIINILDANEYIDHQVYLCVFAYDSKDSVFGDWYYCTMTDIDIINCGYQKIVNEL